MKNGYRVAIGYYNKSLLALKMLFDDNKLGCISDQKQAIDLISNVEIPVCLNLALCYIKSEQFHYGIKYTSQVLEKGLPDESFGPSLEKAYFRRAQCYFGIGELQKAKVDLNGARALAEKQGRSI